MLGCLVISLGFMGCTSLENALVYRPVPGAVNYEAPPPPLQDLKLTLSDGTKIHARWAPHPNATGAVLYCHGNGGNIDLWGGTVRETWDNLNESVLIFDYPGYGYSEGKPSEASCGEAAWAAYYWLTQIQKVPAARVLIMGESLGGGVAVDLASRLDNAPLPVTPNVAWPRDGSVAALPSPEYRALILVRTFTSVADVADDQFPLLFSEPFVTNHFDNLKNIPLCKQPVFIAQADKDRTIPFRHGVRLQEACKAPVDFCVLRGMGHNDPLPGEFYVALRQFLAKTPPR
jgi:pimeloyl-ACP methyl ester carboxylesterase